MHESLGAAGLHCQSVHSWSFISTVWNFHWIKSVDVLYWLLTERDLFSVCLQCHLQSSRFREATALSANRHSRVLIYSLLSALFNHPNQRCKRTPLSWNCSLQTSLFLKLRNSAVMLQVMKLLFSFVLRQQETSTVRFHFHAVKASSEPGYTAGLCLWRVCWKQKGTDGKTLDRLTRSITTFHVPSHTHLYLSGVSAPSAELCDIGGASIHLSATTANMLMREESQHKFTHL